MVFFFVFCIYLFFWRLRFAMVDRAAASRLRLYLIAFVMADARFQPKTNAHVTNSDAFSSSPSTLAPLPTLCTLCAVSCECVPPHSKFIVSQPWDMNIEHIHLYCTYDYYYLSSIFGPHKCHTKPLYVHSRMRSIYASVICYRSRTEEHHKRK